MGSKSPENEAIALRVQRRGEQKYHDQGDNRLCPETSDQVPSRSRVPSSGQSPADSEIPRTFRKKRTSSSTHRQGASLLSATYNEDVIDDSDTHESGAADDFDSSSNLQQFHTAPTTNYSHRRSREQRHAFQTDQSRLPPPSINPLGQHGGFFPPTSAAQNQQEQTNLADYQGVGSWNNDPAYQASSEPDYVTQSTATPIYHQQWSHVSSSRPVGQSGVVSLDSQLAGVTLGPEESETPEYGAATTTTYSPSPVVTEGVATSAHIVPQEPSTPDASKGTTANRLRRSFTLRKKEFFVFGRVLKVWWAEPAGTQSKGATIVTDNRGEGIATKVRWFVVVRPSELYSICLPIQTYELKGVSKAGVNKCQHAVIYTCDTQPWIRPEELPRESELPMKQSICVKPTQHWYKFDQMSRINYGKTYTVEHNVKIEDFGMVIPAHHYLLQASFHEIFFPQTRMSAFPTSQGGSAYTQSDFAGIGAHSHHQISEEQNTSLEDGIPPNQSYFSASANPPTTDPASTYYDDQATGKDRETSDYHAMPELGLHYTPQSQQQYYPQPTDPLMAGHGEASPSLQGPISHSQAYNQGSYSSSRPLLGPTGPPQGQYHDCYGPPPPPSGPIAPAQAQHHNSYSPSPSYGGQKRQSRHYKGRKG